MSLHKDQRKPLADRLAGGWQNQQHPFRADPIQSVTDAVVVVFGFELDDLFDH
jgi:hypothetical protein